MNEFKIKQIEKETEEEFKSKRIGIGLLIFMIVGIIIVFVLKSIGKNKGATESYIRRCTISAINYYYPLKFPDTFKLKTINYEMSEYEDKGYELWRTTGYFTAESSIGLEIKKTYEVYLKFVYEEDKCYYMKVTVDGELLHYTPL